MSSVDSSNGLRRVIGAREDRQAGDEQRHVAGALWREGHDRRCPSSSAFAPAISRSNCVMIGWPFSLSIFSENATSCAVSRVPSWNLRLRPDEEPIGEAVGRDPHLCRRPGRTWRRARPRTRHQGGEGQFHALRGVALEDVAVERIEGEEVLVELPAWPDLRKHSALRGVRIDVVEMAEVRRIFEIAESGNAVDFDGRRSACAAEKAGVRDRGGATRQQKLAPATRLRPGVAYVTAGSRSSPPWRHPTTTRSGTPTRRISAADRDGRSGPSARCALCRRSIAARRNCSTAARGRAPCVAATSSSRLLAKTTRSIMRRRRDF